MNSVDIEIEIDPKRSKYARREVRAANTEVSPRIPRITRLMALAIKFQDMIDRGEVRDYADLAKLGYVSRARITQIMNLTNLAPDIQEEILFLTCAGTRAPVRERAIRPLCRQVDWPVQQDMWRGPREAGAASRKLAPTHANIVL